MKYEAIISVTNPHVQGILKNRLEFNGNLTNDIVIDDNVYKAILSVDAYEHGGLGQVISKLNPILLPEGSVIKEEIDFIIVFKRTIPTIV